MPSLESITFGFVLDALQTVALIVVWLRKPGQDATSAVKDMKGRLDVIEERIKHMSTDVELADLKGTVAAIKATLDGMAVTNVALQSAVVRVERYLLEHRVP